MPMTIRDAFDKVFRPLSDGRRQVVALSRASAERLPALASVAIISITGPGKAAAALANFEHILRLSFADVDFMASELSPRAASKLVDKFTSEQARQILDFVGSLPDGIKTLVVHCEGGFSRSCAVAQAMHDLFGYRVDQELLEAANKSVVETIRREAAKGKGRGGKKRAGKRD